MIERRGIVIHLHELDEVWLNRCQELNLNVLGLHPTGGVTADESLQRLLDQLPRLQPLLNRAREMGIRIEYELHALSYLMPRTLFDAHPEWFCENAQGERSREGFNICASNAEGLAMLMQRAEGLARLLPSENHLYYFWLDDVTSCSCHCARCRRLTPSDQQMLLVNAMLRGIRRADQEGCLAYLAYMDTLNAPRQVAPEEGVFLEYAPIRRSVKHPIDDPDCPENVAERAPLERLLEVFGRKNAKVLDYWTDNSLFSKWKYPPKPFALDAEVMQKDVAFYRSLGFSSITAFGCFLGKDYTDLYGAADLSAYGKILTGA